MCHCFLKDKVHIFFLKIVYNLTLLNAVKVKLLWEVCSQVLTFVVHKNHDNSTFLRNKAINERRRIILELKKIECYAIVRLNHV